MSKRRQTIEERRREHIANLERYKEAARLLAEQTARSAESQAEFEKRVQELTDSAPRGFKWMTFGLRRRLRKDHRQLDEIVAKSERLEEQIRTIEDELSNTYHRVRPRRARVLVVTPQLLLIAVLAFIMGAALLRR